MNTIKLEKYSAYKISNLEWLGDIPTHWELGRLKNIFFESLTQNKDRKCNFYLSVLKDIGVIPFSEKGNKGNKTSLDTSNYRLVKKGDIVLNTTNVCIGSVGLSKYDGCLSSVMYIVLRPIIPLEIRYYDYIFKVRAFQKHLRKISNGILEIREYLNKTLFKVELLPIPSVEEQTRIANFLDDKCAKLNQAIQQKERLITLLQERKQIIIQNAVTRGLNPAVKMKDSGVDWIGEIPEGWSLPKLKHITAFILDGTHGSYPRVQDGFRLLSVRNMINDKFVFRVDDSCVSAKHFKEISSRFLIKKGDIQLAIVGATLGKVAIADEYNEEFVTQRSVCTIRLHKDKCVNTYLFFFIKSALFQNYLWNNAGYSAQPGVYLGTIQNCYIPFPKLTEQAEIASYLDLKSKKIDKAIQQQTQQIEKLKEYKQVLINEVVTGKVKV